MRSEVEGNHTGSNPGIKTVSSEYTTLCSDHGMA